MLLFSGSVVSESLQPHGLQHSRRPCPSLSPSLLKLMSIESLMPSNHLILSLPLLLLPSIFPSIRVFSNESVLYIRWPKYWSFGFDISPSSEYSGLICFRIDWFDLLAIQGTLKSLLPKHSLKASFFLALSLLYSSVGEESTCNAGDPSSIPGSAREGIGYPLQYSWASLMAQLVKNPPAMWETWV